MSKTKLFGRVLSIVAREVIKEYTRSGVSRRKDDNELERKIAQKRQQLSSSLEALQQTLDHRAEKGRREAQFEKEQRELDEKSGGGAYPFELLRDRHVVPAIALIRPYPPHLVPARRSHIGGRPDLPVSVPWPRADDGVPFHFLAQVDFAELPQVGERSVHQLPEIGTLLFFVRMDEEMLLDETDSFRLIFDASSVGQPTEPPSDLSPLDEEWKSVFAAEDDVAASTLPYWPLQAVAIRSLPDACAFDINAHGDPKFDEYIPRLRKWRADEIQRGAGLLPAEASDNHWPDLAIFSPRQEYREPAKLKSFEATGYPYAARGIALTARSLLRHCKHPRFAQFATELRAWQDYAEARPASERVTTEEANAFIERVNAVLRADVRTYEDKEGSQRQLYETNVKSAVEVAVHRLVTETGGDPDLAAVLPVSLYQHAYSRHAPLAHRGDSQSVQHAQMLGYVPSSQYPLPVSHRTLTLLQLPSDRGLDMIIGDMGELDFHIEPDALAERAWHRVSVRHLGR